MILRQLERKPVASGFSILGIALAIAIVRNTDHPDAARGVVCRHGGWPYTIGSRDNALISLALAESLAPRIPRNRYHTPRG